jgi:hypothetical protein
MITTTTTPADDMLGLGRLFADDTSIEHTAHDETTLKNMIIEYIFESYLFNTFAHA